MCLTSAQEPPLLHHQLHLPRLTLSLLLHRPMTNFHHLITYALSPLHRSTSPKTTFTCPLTRRLLSSSWIQMTTQIQNGMPKSFPRWSGHFHPRSQSNSLRGQNPFR